MTPTLLGIPWDAHSSFQRGAAAAPAAIRAALRSESSNSWNEDVMDVAPRLADAGDLALDGADDPRGLIQARVAALLASGARPILLGGDHAVTWPIVRAVRPAVRRLTIVHIDAHPDLYESLDGDRFSHATPFARIMEEKLADRLIQLGIRTMNAHQQEQAARFGVEVVPMRAGVEAMRRAVESVEGPVYLSLDLDALDPAFVPGISHPEPGGLSTREVIGLIQALPRGAGHGGTGAGHGGTGAGHGGTGTYMVAADLVELNPANDVRDLTARVAAKLVKEIVGVMGE